MGVPSARLAWHINKVIIIIIIIIIINLYPTDDTIGFPNTYQLDSAIQRLNNRSQVTLSFCLTQSLTSPKWVKWIFKFQNHTNIIWKRVYLQLGISFFQNFLFPLALGNKGVLCLYYKLDLFYKRGSPFLWDDFIQIENVIFEMLEIKFMFQLPLNSCFGIGIKK